MKKEFKNTNITKLRLHKEKIPKYTKLKNCPEVSVYMK